MGDRVRVGRHTVDIVNADKPFFPKDGISKGDLVQYYRRIARTMLPYLRGRPIAVGLPPATTHSRTVRRRRAL